MILGKRIHTLRKKRRLGLRALARMAEVPHVTLSQLERGLQADVTTGTAKRIAQALDTSIDYLVGRFEEGEDDDRVNT
jgi:transcriptional regulator with XRE-family HTH domain